MHEKERPRESYGLFLRPEPGTTFLPHLTYKQGKVLNYLVIIDEAYRLAPRERQENQVLESIELHEIEIKYQLILSILMISYSI
jgi:hypothetical protein